MMTRKPSKAEIKRHRKAAEDVKRNLDRLIDDIQRKGEPDGKKPKPKT